MPPTPKRAIQHTAKHTSKHATKRGARRAKGAEGEQRACQWLESRGFRILARNYFTRFGEIDIIALRDEALHFIEVKCFLAHSLSPRYAITHKKLARIYASIEVLLFSCGSLHPSQIAKKGEEDTRAIAKALHSLHIDIHTCQYSVDALLIWGDSIELLENISLA